MKLMKLSPLQLDALAEMINIGVGKAAEVLNEMIKSHVSLQVPQIRVLFPSNGTKDLSGFSKERFSSVQLPFSGSLGGLAALYFPPQSAATLVDILVGERSESLDLDSLKIGTLTEVGNILLNGVVGSLANSIGQHVQFSVPTYEEQTIAGLMTSNIDNLDHVIVAAETEFSVEHLQIRGHVLLVLKVSSFKGLVSFIDGTLSREAGEGP